MDGPHDLGGRMNFGPVVIEPNEPVFHERWEAAALMLVGAVSSKVPNFTLSMFRHAVERMDPAHYLSSPYYEHWLTAAATMAVEAGVVSREELEKRARGPFPLARPVRTDRVDDLAAGRARFAVGDRVRAWQRHPLGHTRCPGYLRGHIGVVTRRHGSFSLPDLEVHSTRRVREAVYSVRFDAGKVWWDGQTGIGLNADLWESYLEKA
ncbi:MAG: nitrile hydratase subunit beta [Rhodospirillaceae bacterium]|jgi:nitrile hydratase beta subunit|nr:nitrile hydratase subunit beta [Rhodospirillaceae bacterium]